MPCMDFKYEPTPMLDTMATAKPTKPGIPNSTDGDNPISSAQTKSRLRMRGADFCGKEATMDTYSARLAPQAQITMSGTVELGGAANGNRAADSAISTLYLRI